MEFITGQNNLNYDTLKYKIELINFHGIEWFKNTKFGGKCSHLKIKIVNLYKMSDLSYKDFCLQNGLYSLNSLKKGLNDFEIITKESEENDMEQINKKLAKMMKKIEKGVKKI